jgi:myo-inositol-1(or 4)-monophosphatase
MTISKTLLHRTLVSALEAGGRVVKRGFPRDKIIVERKGPTSLVTQVDRASEKAILSVIQKRFPGHGIVAEESPVKLSTEPCRWFIDPLDGTTNFIHGVPLVCVSIGLELEGRLILGGVYNPMSGEMFLAQRGRGAHLNGKPIHVSKVSGLADALFVTGFPYDRSNRAVDYVKFFEAFLAVGQGVRRLGAAALDLAWLAAGRFEGFWEFRLSSWDVAAGALIVEEAGGRITDAFGRKYPYDKPVSTLATNDRVHSGMVKVIRQVNEFYKMNYSPCLSLSRA